MDNQRILEIILSARDEASKKIEEVGDKVQKTGGVIDKMSSQFRVAGAVMIGAGVAGAAAMFQWAEKANEAQIETIRTNTAIANTAEAMKLSGKETSALIALTQKLGEQYIELGFDDETTAAAFAKLISVTKDQEFAQKALAASADLARAKNISLDDAAQSLNMAFMGNERVLKQLGITVGAHATKQEILAAVLGKVSGQAENYSNTYAGAMDRLNVKIANLQEKLGEKLLPIMADFVDKIVSVIDKVNQMNPQMLDMIVKVTAIGTAFFLIAGPIALIIGSLNVIIPLITGIAVAAGPVILIIGALALVAFLLYQAWNTNFLGIRDIVSSVFNYITTVIIPSIGPAINSAITTLQGFMATVFSIFGSIRDFITFAISSAINGITSGIQNMINFVNNIKDIAVKAFHALVDPIVNILHMIKFPHVSIGHGSSEIAGRKIEYPTFNVDWYEKGGWVPNTGLAMLHSGEFVVSKDMLSGRKAMPDQISNRSYSQPITIYASVGSDVDINMLGYKLAWMLRNSR